MSEAPPEEKHGLLGRFKTAVAMMRTRSPSQTQVSKPALVDEATETVAPILFGVPLIEARHLHSEYFDEQAGIPSFIITAMEWILGKHADCEGLFRINGSSTTIKSLIAQVEGNCLELPDSLDPHAVTGLIKQYLRDLPEPLLCSQLYEPWSEMCQMLDPNRKASVCHHLQSQLPTEHGALLNYLLEHLKLLTEHAEKTKMDALNLATCIGPNLLRPPPTSREEEALNVISVTSTAAQVCLYLLQENDDSDGIKAIARATFDYEPTNEDELELHEGQLVYIEDDGEEWWVGFTLHHHGRFPNNYVTILTGELQREKPSLEAKVANLEAELKDLRLELAEERAHRERLEALISSLTASQQQILSFLQSSFPPVSSNASPLPPMPSGEGNSLSGNEASSERSDD